MTTRDFKYSALFGLTTLVVLFANGESTARQADSRYGQTAQTLPPPRSVQVYGETLEFRTSSLDPKVKSILARLKLRRTTGDRYEDANRTVALTFDNNHQLRSVAYFSGQPVMGDRQHHDQYSDPLPFIGKAFPLAFDEFRTAFGAPSTDLTRAGLCMFSWSFGGGKVSWGPTVHCDADSGVVGKFEIDGGLADASARTDGRPITHPIAPVHHDHAIEGSYRVTGRNRNGGRYQGICSVTRVDANQYRFQWKIDVPYYGMGTIKGDTVTVHWGAPYPAIYKIQPDGTLAGSWDNGRASETLIPAPRAGR